MEGPWEPVLGNNKLASSKYYGPGTMLEGRVTKTQRIKFMSSRNSQSEGETGVYTDGAGCPCCRSDQLLSFAGE